MWIEYQDFHGRNHKANVSKARLALYEKRIAVQFKIDGAVYSTLGLTAAIAKQWAARNKKKLRMFYSPKTGTAALFLVGHPKETQRIQEFIRFGDAQEETNHGERT